MLKEHYTVEISEEYIYAKTSLSETKYCWEVFVEFRETKNLFVFYFSSIMMWVIPKSAFLEKADLDQFRNLAKEQIPSQFNYKNKN